MSGGVIELLDRWSRRYVVPSGLAPARSTRGVTVVTGASEGIGLAIARRFAQAGDDVVLVARRRDLLLQGAKSIVDDFGTIALPLVIDVNDRDAPAAIEAALREQGMHVRTLVNNAGFGLTGPFSAMDEAALEALVGCNVAALTRLCRHFLPQMLAHADGGILNVGSLAGFAPGPYQAAYYASKAYVIALTRALEYETRGRGVRMSVLTPGPVATAFHDHAQAQGSLYHRIIPLPSADGVAAAAYRGYRWHRSVIVPGLFPKLLRLAMNIVPHTLVIPAVAALLYPGPPRSVAGRSSS